MSNLFNKFTEKLHNDDNDDQDTSRRQQRGQQRGQQQQKGGQTWDTNEPGDDNFNIGGGNNLGYETRDLNQQQQREYGRDAMGQSAPISNADESAGGFEQDAEGLGLNDEEEEEEEYNDDSFGGTNLGSGNRRTRRNQGNQGW